MIKVQGKNIFCDFLLFLRPFCLWRIYCSKKVKKLKKNKIKRKIIEIK